MTEISITIAGPEQVAAAMEALREAGFSVGRATKEVSAAAQPSPAPAAESALRELIEKIPHLEDARLGFCSKKCLRCKFDEALASQREGEVMSNERCPDTPIDVAYQLGFDAGLTKMFDKFLDLAARHYGIEAGKKMGPQELLARVAQRGFEEAKEIAARIICPRCKKDLPVEYTDRSGRTPLHKVGNGYTFCAAAAILALEPKP